MEPNFLSSTNIQMIQMQSASAQNQNQSIQIQIQTKQMQIPMETDTEADTNENNSDTSEETTEPLNNNNQRRSPILIERFQTISMYNPPGKNPCAFACAILGICCVIPAAGCGLAIALAVLAIMNCVPISAIVIGALYLDKKFCPSENISIILIVGGSLLLVQGVLKTAFKVYGTRGGGNSTNNIKDKTCSCLDWMYLASFAWFIAACVIVYRLHSDVNFDDSTSVKYCHPILYLYAFWFLTIIWILLCLLLIFEFCACICAACQNVKKDEINYIS